MIRILFANQIIFSLQKLVKVASLFVVLVAITAILFFSSNYIINLLSDSLWDAPTSTTEATDSSDVIKEIIVKQGDTLSAILKGQNLPTDDIASIIRSANAEKFSSKLAIGQVIKFHYVMELIDQEESNLVEEKLILNRISIKIDNVQSIEFVRSDEGFTLQKITAPLKRLITKYEVTINNNVISALQKTGMSNNSIIKLITAYSYQIDMQRQIKSGDKLTIITEKFVTSDDKFSHHGKILHASLNSMGTAHNIYLYSPSGAEEDSAFFLEDGQSVKSSLLKTPLDVARISSHFGYRKQHPVLGFGRMHKGVDFSASAGTPIYAAGDGVLQFMGWKAGYGKFVIIKHANNLSTAYAHASKFAKNMRIGSKIKQGQVIAYVGSTGHATGPHLHYEIRVNGTQVNPLKFKSTPGIKLAGKQLTKFNIFKKKLSGLSNKLETVSAIEPTELEKI